MNIRAVFLMLWAVFGFIGGLFLLWFFELLLDLLFIYAFPWFRHHPVILLFAEYFFSVMIVMALIWFFWRKAIYPRAPKTIKGELPY